MLVLSLMFAFFAVFALALALMPVKGRPTLKLNPVGSFTVEGMEPPVTVKPKKKKPLQLIFSMISKLAFFNKPLAVLPLGRRMATDLGMSRTAISVEEFFLIKEILVLIFLWTSVSYVGKEILLFSVLMSIAAGYMLPELWLKARIKKVRDTILRELPDTVDLLGLCVNAGLDFMMALKYVVEKSHGSVIIEELKSMMQEINVGKPRRDALRDMARKYEMPDLSTFSRTLIQADRMGTSVSEALNILSEDMREARFRRGETVALKAPLKMLIPLLFFIFPVVAILVAGPIFLDFIQNNPLQALGAGK
ncbi:MAG: type II secretion system F family protein [Candidatus Omnitrophota bacterium]|nr:type II secretion system F family protein [Candidatus Omnitrophota bacterium]